MIGRLPTTKGYAGAVYHTVYSSLNLQNKKGKRLYPAGIGGHICAYLNEIKLKMEDTEFETKVLFSA